MTLKVVPSKYLNRLRSLTRCNSLANKPGVLATNLKCLMMLKPGCNLVPPSFATPRMPTSRASFVSTMFSGIPLFVERKVRYSALFTYLVGKHVGAVSFPLIDVILAQLVCPLSDVMFLFTFRNNLPISLA
jgi:hypothetical protein